MCLIRINKLKSKDMVVCDIFSPVDLIKFDSLRLINCSVFSDQHGHGTLKKHR